MRMDIELLARRTGSEILETHISWVLMGEFVYKVKKPVRFSFLDFSSLDRRKHFCQEEVRLNSRLCPEVYLGVVGIGEDSDFCPIESASEYAVKMVRLDEGKKMSNLLKADKISASDIEALAGMIADFHLKAEPAPAYNSAEQIAAQVADLGGFRGSIEKASGLGKWVDRLLSKSALFIRRNRELIERRRKGYVRDCHGDLHSHNIFFQDGIKIIDCIEFSRDFRCLDVASDLAFLAMDLDYSGREDLSELLVRTYIARTGDKELESLLLFYKCYRANVRAKIAAIEWAQKPSDGARERIDRYVLLAESYSKRLS